ncbi:hypothetical protein C9J41_00030 [Photobacterium sp. GB-50]|nr:hypothetical protein C9J41_00030 [Photobacterium sp. GB-50]
MIYSLGFLVCGFQVMFIATHLPNYFADKDLPAPTAAIAQTYVGIFNILDLIFGAFGVTDSTNAMK